MEDGIHVTATVIVHVRRMAAMSLPASFYYAYRKLWINIEMLIGFYIFP
jgi:hypothetical protein